jgi:hypothetical protein
MAQQSLTIYLSDSEHTDLLAETAAYNAYMTARSALYGTPESYTPEEMAAGYIKHMLAVLHMNREEIIAPKPVRKRGL